jgi:hypothetical protein
MNERQIQALSTLIDRPNSKIDGRVLPALRRQGLLGPGDRPKLHAWHTLGRWKNAPRLALPSEEQIGFFEGKSILVTERRSCDCPSCGGFHDEKTFEVDAQRVVRFTGAVREFANELITRSWTSEWDASLEYSRDDQRVRGQVSLFTRTCQRRAESEIPEDRAGIDLRYTSHLVLHMGEALMEEPTRHTLPQASTGQKSSFSDTDWEAEALRPGQGAKIVASMDISLH